MRQDTNMTELIAGLPHAPRSVPHPLPGGLNATPLTRHMDGLVPGCTADTVPSTTKTYPDLDLYPNLGQICVALSY